MIAFLQSLFSDGELNIPRPESAFDERQALDAVTQFERVWRCELPGDPPEFVAESAVKAAQILMAVCQAVIHREINIEQTEQTIDQACLTTDDTPSLHYSVDLVFRYLPQVDERARRISESDALLDLLKTLGRRWPLSSVGTKGCVLDQLPTALQHPSLWRMYVDRIISTKDVSRVNIPSVRDAVAAALGPFPHLAPEFSTAIQSCRV